MNKTKLALAVGALGMMASQAALAGEFTVSGVIEYTYNYNTGGVTSGVNYGDQFEVTVTYEDDPGTSDYWYTYTQPDDYYGNGYTQSQAQWYNSIQAVSVVVYDADGNVTHSRTITPNEEGVTYSHNTAGNYQVDYTNQTSDFEQVYFDVYTQTNSGEVSSNHQIQVYFWGYALNLVVDSEQFPQVPDQTMLDSGAAWGQLWTYDYNYNNATGQWEQWQYGGRITAASGVIPNAPDADGDGIPDAEDAFPNDATESADTDGDGVGNNSDVFPNDATESVDTDGDGVGNNADQNDNSDLSATVSIDGNNSGVANTLLANGQTIADVISASSADCKATAKNHGAYVSCVGKTLKALKDAGTISDADKGVLQSTVAKSSFGKK